MIEVPKADEKAANVLFLMNSLRLSDNCVNYVLLNLAGPAITKCNNSYAEKNRVRASVCVL